MAGVAVTVALQASWELALPLVAFAALIAGALLSFWWLRRWVAGAEEAPRFATLPQTQLWVAVSAGADWPKPRGGTHCRPALVAPI